MSARSEELRAHPEYWVGYWAMTSALALKWIKEPALRASMRSDLNAFLRTGLASEDLEQQIRKEMRSG